MKIALLITCLADALFPDVGRATVRLLERLGHDVAFPEAQTCCGQMHVNTGYQDEALPLVRHHVEVFEPYDVVVAPSGSCVGSVRHQHAMVARRAGDEALAERRRGGGGERPTSCRSCWWTCSGSRTSARTTRTGSPTTRPATRCACCGWATSRCGCCATCAGMTLIELPAADQCCGFGGTFALKNPDTSTAMLADKMRHVLSTGAEALTAGDASCLMHIGGGLSRLRSGTRTVHLAEILAESVRPTHSSRGGAMSTFLGMPVVAPAGVGHLRGTQSFPDAARTALADTQLRRNLGHATAMIRNKRAAVVAELDDWEALRRAGEAIKTATMARLDEHLQRLEEQVTARGGVVHWARDANEANRIVTDLVRATGQTEVVKVKSMATQEIGLNEALEARGSRPRRPTSPS